MTFFASLTRYLPARDPGPPSSSISIPVGRETTVLAGRDIKTTDPEGSRNPIVRVLRGVKHTLERKFAAVVPCFGSNRAAASTRLNLRRVLEHLASHETDTHALVASLRRLGSTQRQWEWAAPEAREQFQRAIEDTVSRQLSPQQRDALLGALVGPRFKAAQDLVQAAGDTVTEWALVHVAGAVTRAVADCEFKAIELKFDRALETIRHVDESGIPETVRPRVIADAANRAISEGRKILERLRKNGALAPAEPHGHAVVESNHAQTAAILRELIEKRLTAYHTGAGEITTLLRHLSSEGLRSLRVTPAASDPIALAVEREITERLNRLAEYLQWELEPDHPMSVIEACRWELEVERPFDLGNKTRSIDGQVIGMNLSRVDALKSFLLDHCVTFALPIPAYVRYAFEGDTLRVAGREDGDTL